MKFKKATRVIAIMVLLCLLLQLLGYAAESSPSVESSTDYAVQTVTTVTYYNYINGFSKDYATRDAFWNLSDAVLHNATQKQVLDREAIEFDTAGGRIESQVFVEADGLYCLWISFAGLQETESNILFSVQVDGEEPFFETQSMPLYRQFEMEKEGEFPVDGQGNDLKPNYIQKSVFETCTFYQKTEGMVHPYFFHLTKGTHQVELTCLNEGVAISELWFGPNTVLSGYDAYAEKYKGKAEKADGSIVLDAEKPSAVSTKTIYPLCDQNDPNTFPFSQKVTKLNYVGGTNWDAPGEWIEWKMEVPETGLYSISLRARQNQLRGMKSYRSIRINGEIPFAELSAYGFAYSRKWQVETLGDATTDTPYLFYLEKGTNTLRMEVTSGEMMQPLLELDDALNEINHIYREITMITGAEPDIYRDYNLEKSIPDLVGRMKGLSERLDGIMQMLYDITGTKATNANVILTMASQLKDLAKRPKTIVDRIGTYYTNMTAVSAWLLSARQQPLDIDVIEVSAQKTELTGSAPWVKRFVSAITAWLYSYVIDYDEIGDDVAADRTITVWMQSGREQAEALKQLINKSFSKETGINVKLRLVQGGLLESTVSGKGPDVALNTAMYIPVDYASRGVLLPMDSYVDFSDFVADNFMDTATKPFIFDGHTYALPETQDFGMMFYRSDILKELNLSPPQTWTELKEILNVLALNNMQVGVSCLTTTSAGTVNLSMPQSLLTILMQNGISLYNEELTQTNLDSQKAAEAIESLTDLYTKYGLPIYFDAVNRFRTGEMPIIISSLNTYNMLMVSAPELQDRWAMTLIPGTKMQDGTISRKVEFNAAASIIFKKAKDPDACWTFLKWWCSADAQTQYGLAVENILGPSGRYLTANKKAFESLPWDSAAAQAVSLQWQSADTVYQIPGYYFVSRYLNNALSDVILRNESVNNVLNRNVPIINNEIQRKRRQIYK